MSLSLQWRCPSPCMKLIYKMRRQQSCGPAMILLPGAPGSFTLPALTLSCCWGWGPCHHGWSRQERYMSSWIGALLGSPWHVFSSPSVPGAGGSFILSTLTLALMAAWHCGRGPHCHRGLRLKRFFSLTFKQAWAYSGGVHPCAWN